MVCWKKHLHEVLLWYYRNPEKCIWKPSIFPRRKAPMSVPSMLRNIHNAYRQQGLFCGSWEDELMNAQSKREREKQLVSQMIALYCRKKHGGKGLCPDCAALNTYARQRSDRCPFMETKTFCSNCKVHCYKPEMRSQIRAVMRFSGPRMVFHHPVIAVRHVIETSKEKRRLEKTT